MINFAFCNENEKKLVNMKREIEKRFIQKGVIVAIKCYKNARALERCLSCNCPDVLFYDIEGENGLMRDIALSAKQHNPKLISVITQNADYSPHAKDALLEPVYTIPDNNPKYLWTYASLAYESLRNDDNSFSYYIRPNFQNIPIHDIRYFASEGRRTHVAYRHFRDTFYQKLNDVEKHVSHKNARFIRIHQSYLVNTDYISSYNRRFVVLTTGEKFRISKYEYYKTINDTFRKSNVKRNALI